jgi:hypothetical protein
MHDDQPPIQLIEQALIIRREARPNEWSAKSAGLAPTAISSGSKSKHDCDDNHNEPNNNCNNNDDYDSHRPDGRTAERAAQASRPPTRPPRPFAPDGRLPLSGRRLMAASRHLGRWAAAGTGWQAAATTTAAMTRARAPTPGRRPSSRLPMIIIERARNEFQVMQQAAK